MILSGVVVIGCYLAGRLLGEDKKLSEAESYMLAGLPVREIYRKLSGTDEVGRMFSRMTESGETDANSLWEKELEKVSLSSEDKKILKAFSEELGKTTTELQKKNFSVTITSLGAQLTDAERKYEKEGVVYRKLGACAGLLLCIFLI